MSDLLIEGLVPALADKARQHRARAFALGLDFIFTCGARTWSEQMDEYAKGRARTAQGWMVMDPHKVVTHALPDVDPHVRRAAYDVCPIVNERAAWDRLDLFAELGRIGKELGLAWGGDWPHLVDRPHFELVGWRDLPLPAPPAVPGDLASGDPVTDAA